MKQWRYGAYFIVFLGVLLLHAWPRHGWQLPKKDIKKTLSIVGSVASIPISKGGRLSFDFITQKIQNKNVTAHLRVSWYQNPPAITVGDVWRLLVRLKPPLGLHNPGGFDYRAYLVRQGIAATGYIVALKKSLRRKRVIHCGVWVAKKHRQLGARKKNSRVIKDGGVKDNLLLHGNHLLQRAPWRYPIDTLRQRIVADIHQAIRYPMIASLISALTVGVRGQMSTHSWQVLQATGTSHLMAISGLHVGMVAAVVFFIASFLWRLNERLMLFCPAQRAAGMVVVAVALAYALLAGFSLPTQRAVIMLLVLFAGNFTARKIPVWKRLFYAFLLIIAVQPAALISASLWLSFSAVAFICYGMRGQTARVGWWVWLRVQWVVCLGLLPVTLYFFQKLSLVMFAANLIAIPWVSFLVLPMALMAVMFYGFSVAASKWMFSLAGYCLQPLWMLLQWIGKWPWVVWHHSIPNIWVLFSSIIAVVILLSPWRWRVKSVAILFALPLFLYHPVRPKQHAITLTVLDVGQGLATVVQTQKHTLIFDTGPRSYGGFDAGKEVLLPYLYHLGIYRLDKVIISHSDMDHRGGVSSLLTLMPARQVLTSEPKRLKRWRALACQRGQHWQWDGVRFQMLWPAPGEKYQGNASSCVLKISNGQSSILLPGDIEKPTEQRLLQEAGPSLASSILVAAHHGSRTSSSPAFLRAVNPRVVIFASGAYNRYHFPSNEVVARYRKQGVAMYNTAVHGAIIVRISANGKVTCTTTKTVT